ILEIMKDLSAATACFDEGFWHTALGDKDQDKKKSQLFASISSGLASALKVLPATIDALEETEISAVDPFYGAAITAKEDTARVKLTTPLGKLQMAGYLAFAALSYVAGLGVEGTKAYAAWLNAENEVQEAEKKMLPAYLQEQCAEELRKEHPDWTEKQISDEAKKKAEEMAETDGDALLEKNHDAIDKMLEEGDSADEFAALRRAKWHKMGRSIAQSLAETLIPEAVAFIAVCTKAGKFTSASRLGGLLLCAEDSNAVMGARKETRVSSDEKLFLAAGTGHSIYSRYTKGDTLQERLETDFGLAGGDSAVVQRADVLSGLALKKSEHTSLGTISAQAKDAITLTTKYKQADIARALAGCSTELADATTALGLHVKEFGTDAPGLTAALGTAATNMTALAAQFAAPPPEYTELSLGRSGAKQQAKLACQGAGCTISLAGTATDSSGVFEAKMANAGSTSTLELKNDSAQVKATKGADASSLSLASKIAKLASKDSSLDIDGARKQAVLEAGGASRLEIHANSGFHFKSDKNFVANVSKSIKLNASDVSLLKGKVKFSNASIDAKASGSVSLKGGMIKIG
ncbi:MAG: hypothetical protein IKX75_07935, partial [Desulfovibrio sp.]|nr:hypothetical protein [Desulfovibrio sp.]